MAKECFCGCGLRVPLFTRRRAANAVGDRIDRDVATFRGALARGGQGEHEAELAELVALGAPLRDTLRNIVHGTIDRTRYDKRAGGAWLDRAHVQRGRLAQEIVRAGYAGWDALGQSELVHAGRRARAVVVAVEDTGLTINDNPRVRIRLRVEPDGEPAFELERKLVVSRVSIPRAGERVEVLYDPDDPGEFTFRIDDLTDDRAEPDRLERLALLGRLRADGVLTEEEFEAEKARILGAG